MGRTECSQAVVAGWDVLVDRANEGPTSPNPSVDVGFGVDAIDDEVMSLKREPRPKSELDTDKTWDSATMSRAVPKAYQGWVHSGGGRVPRSLQSELMGIEALHVPLGLVSERVLNDRKRFSCIKLRIQTLPCQRECMIPPMKFHSQKGRPISSSSD